MTKKTLTKDKRLCGKPHVDNSKKTENKLGDPVYPFIIEKLKLLGIELFNIEIKPVKIGMLYKQAGDIGNAVIAFNRASKWAAKDLDYYGAVQKELSERRGKIINNVQCAGWKDSDWDLVKAENNNFDSWIDRKFSSERNDDV